MVVESVARKLDTWPARFLCRERFAGAAENYRMPELRDRARGAARLGYRCGVARAFAGPAVGARGYRRVAHSQPAATDSNWRSDSPRQPADAGRFVTAGWLPGCGDVAQVECTGAPFNPGAVTGARQALT